MKKIGILGGIGWPSTVEYYAGLCRLAELHRASPEALATLPEISVESLDLARAAARLGNGDEDGSWAAFDEYHRNGLRRLEQSGADFAIIASNTAHHRLKQITQGIGMPVLSIVEVAARACARLRVRRLLILGSAQVMDSKVLRDAFARYCIEAAAPRDGHGRRAIAATIGALQRGRSDGAAKCIRSVVAATGAARLKGTTAVYLGCTELPLAFPAQAHEGVFEVDGIRYINSTALHIQAAFERARP
jgi:aspartate racemase